MTRRTVTRKELSLVPGTSGDALRALQNLPGVARPPALSGLLVVRGNADQTTPVFIDGLWLPNVYHFTLRKVRDADGSEGWINQSLLSGKRTAIVAPWQRDKSGTIKLLGKPDKSATVVALVEPGVMGTIRSCDGTWCQMTLGGHTGWIEQTLLWGAYPGEKIKD